MGHGLPGMAFAHARSKDQAQRGGGAFAPSPPPGYASVLKVL